MALYSFALLVALVLSAPWWLWRMATTHKYREGLAERLGRVPARVRGARDSRPIIWIHAVSVGEVLAVSGLVKDLRAKAIHSASSGFRVVVSTTTLTGQRLAQQRFGAENVFYYPLDFAGAVRAYLRALRPRLFVLAETEFWPRMLWECRRAAVPVAVVNARISDRSYPRYLRLRSLWRRILAGLAAVLAQTDEDVTRLKAIGVQGERIRRGGNLKYDVRAASSLPIVEAIKSAIRADGKLLVCGSTLEGEERILLDTWPGLVAATPELRMVLAPRHPERFAAVRELLTRSGIPWFPRSQWKEAENMRFPPGSVLLLDSIGELASVYSLATVAFVGGSLIPAGGHNPLEPAQFGVPIVMGPHYENFREIVNKLLAANGVRIAGEPDLGRVLAKLMQDQDSAAVVGHAAQSIFAVESGATARALEALVVLLDQSPAAGGVG
jgi:3-deoxy-D-manno-octulosonic-acid transferase